MANKQKGLYILQNTLTEQRKEEDPKSPHDISNHL